MPLIFLIFPFDQPIVTSLQRFAIRLQWYGWLFVYFAPRYFVSIEDINGRNRGIIEHSLPAKSRTTMDGVIVEVWRISNLHLLTVVFLRPSSPVAGETMQHLVRCSAMHLFLYLDRILASDTAIMQRKQVDDAMTASLYFEVDRPNTYCTHTSSKVRIEPRSLVGVEDAAQWNRGDGMGDLPKSKRWKYSYSGEVTRCLSSLIANRLFDWLALIGVVIQTRKRTTLCLRAWYLLMLSDHHAHAHAQMYRYSIPSRYRS